MQTSVQAAIEAYFAGVNGEDYAAVGALFAADGELRPPGRRVYRGPEEIAGYLTAALAPYVEHDDRVLRTIVDGNTAAAEIRFEGRQQSGYELDFDAVDIFDLDDQGKLARVVTWCDTHRLREISRAAAEAAAAA
ncbi:MAG: nuclear transport factor 2 family protein [Solirubrobacteraceae bacterium]|nr:nuclear transport factor 2 family protein [Patulibacter sp.]